MLKHILAYARTHVHIYIINMFVPTTEHRYIYIDISIYTFTEYEIEPRHTVLFHVIVVVGNHNATSNS